MGFFSTFLVGASHVLALNHEDWNRHLWRCTARRPRLYPLAGVVLVGAGALGGLAGRRGGCRQPGDCGGLGAAAVIGLGEGILPFSPLGRERVVFD